MFCKRTETNYIFSIVDVIIFHIWAQNNHISCPPVMFITIKTRSWSRLSYFFSFCNLYSLPKCDNTALSHCWWLSLWRQEHYYCMYTRTKWQWSTQFDKWRKFCSAQTREYAAIKAKGKNNQVGLLKKMTFIYTFKCNF